MSSKKLSDIDPRLGSQRGQNLRLLLLWELERMGPEVLEKLQILNVQRMIFIRCPHAVGEAKRPCCCLSWRTLPAASRLPLIPLRHGDGERIE